MKNGTCGIFSSIKKGEILNGGKKSVAPCIRYCFTKKCPKGFPAQNSRSVWMNNPRGQSLNDSQIPTGAPLELQAALSLAPSCALLGWARLTLKEPIAGWSIASGSQGDFGTVPFNSCCCALKVHRGSAQAQSFLKTPWAVSCTHGLMEPLRPEWTDCNDSIRTDPISMTLSHTIPLTLELLPPQWQIIISFKKGKGN